MDDKTVLISEDMTVGDIIQKHPQVTNTLLKYGLHCVGCHVAYWETIGDGARGHGMSDEMVAKMIAECNEVAGKAREDMNDGNPVHVTGFAIKKVRELMERNETSGNLRIAVVSGGCSGFSYEFKIDETIDSEKDVSFEKEGLTIVVDKESLEKLKDAHVDYVESFQGSGFKVDNPNSSSSCGCGNSFA